MAARTFQDAAGTQWEVFEVRRTSAKPGAVSAGMEHGWLTFVNGSEKRRLAPFPAEWEAVADSELARLCGQARAPSPRLAFGESRAITPPAGSPAIAPARERADAAPATAGEAREVERTVRQFAQQARADLTPAVDAMVALKALLLDRFPGADHIARDRRRVRKWFVETYYSLRA